MESKSDLSEKLITLSLVVVPTVLFFLSGMITVLNALVSVAAFVCIGIVAALHKPAKI